MVEVLHEIAPQIRPQVVQEAAAALKSGGWMLIVDETYPSTLEEMRKPEFKFPLMTGFEELFWGNVLPTRDEQAKLLRDLNPARECRPASLERAALVSCFVRPRLGSNGRRLNRSLARK